VARKETIDFSGVSEEIGARGRHIPPGNYKCKIVSGEKKWKDNDKSNVPYFNWKFQVVDGKEKGAPLYYTTSLKPEALWNLRNLIFAATGKNVAGKSVNFSPDTLVGKAVGVVVEDDEWKNKVVSRAVDVMAVKDLEGEDDEDEEETEEEEEEEEDEELEDVDLDEI
jgi:hypothetical protein